MNGDFELIDIVLKNAFIAGVRFFLKNERAHQNTTCLIRPVYIRMVTIVQDNYTGIFFSTDLLCCWSIIQG